MTPAAKQRREDRGAIVALESLPHHLVKDMDRCAVARLGRCLEITGTLTARERAVLSMLTARAEAIRDGRNDPGAGKRSSFPSRVRL